METIREEGEGEGEEDYMAEEEGEDEVNDISYKVNDKVALTQPDLCTIYSALHWTRNPEGEPWSAVEIKHIVGHAILKLDEDEFRRLDLGDVIADLRRDDHALAQALRPVAERWRENWIPHVTQLYAKVLQMGHLRREDEM